MLTYTISVSIRSTLLRYSLVLSEYLSKVEQIQHMPRYTPRYNQYQAEEATYSVTLETNRPGIEAKLQTDCSHLDIAEKMGRAA